MATFNQISRTLGTTLGTIWVQPLLETQFKTFMKLYHKVEVIYELFITVLCQKVANTNVRKSQAESACHFSKILNAGNS